MTRRAAEAALAGNTIIWGATFVLVKTALADISPLYFLALRFSLAAFVLLLLYRRAWFPLPPWQILGRGALTGFFLFTGYLFQTFGLRLTSSAKSAFLTGLSVVTVPLLTVLVYKIKPQSSEVLGIAIAAAGMGLMTLEGPVGSINRGDILTILCAIAFAAHILTLGHFAEKIAFEVLSVAQVGTSALLGLSLFWWVEPVRVVWHPAVVYAILITGLLATALAFTVQAWAQRYTTSTRTALIFALEPVFAWITAYSLAGEQLSGRAALGAVLILTGVLVVEVKPLNSELHL
jgi:drug/metabolite transporter (DMT)-like permease